MDILRLLLYIVAPWLPLLIKKWGLNLKVWQILLLSILLLLPFACPLFLNYWFGNQVVFSISFILFLLSIATLFWILTNNLRFIIFVSLINVFTSILFWSLNWQRNPYDNQIIAKPVFIELKEQNSYYSDIEESTDRLGNHKSYKARRKVLGGILVRQFHLEPISNAPIECLYRGYDYERKKDFYWDKCINKIKAP